MLETLLKKLKKKKKKKKIKKERKKKEIIIDYEEVLFPESVMHQCVVND